jgi:soluble lytic murein transglycosylase-like protein
MPKRRIEKLLRVFVAALLSLIFIIMALRANGQADLKTSSFANSDNDPGLSPCGPSAIKELMPDVSRKPEFSIAADFQKLELSRELNLLLSKSKAGWSSRDKNDVVETLIEIESRYGFRPGLFLRLMKIESNFRIDAVSKDGARGLCQIQPETARQIEKRLGQPPLPEELLFDPVLNLRLSAAYLSFLEQKYKALPKAVSAYNMGPSAFSRIYGDGGIPKGRYHDLLTR